MMLPCEVDIGKSTGDEYPSSLLALGGQGQEERERKGGGRGRIEGWTESVN